MTAQAEHPHSRTQRAPAVCGRIVVGVDGSDEAIEAARQAASLLEPEGELTLLGVYDV
jgi:nucleotide-binding universal stress UspA family protein